MSNSDLIISSALSSVDANPSQQSEPLISTGKSVAYKLVHTWTIHNFRRCLDESPDIPSQPDSSRRHKLTSAKFSSPIHPDIEFQIDLYPKGIKDTVSDYVSVYLNHTTNGVAKEQIWDYNKFSILGVDGKKCYTIIDNDLLDGCTSWGWKRFISHEKLLDPQEGMLPDDKLTIHCELDISYTVKGFPSGGHFENFTIDLKALLDNGAFCDVTLVVDGTEFRVHKVILAARSPVFAAMFQNANFQEAQGGKVNLFDVDKIAFQNLLSYIYSGKLENREHLTEELLVASDKYQIEALKCECEYELIDKITIESAAQMLLFADTYNANILKEMCIKFISDKAAEVANAPGWDEISKTRPQLMLQAYRALALQTRKNNDISETNI